MPKICTFYLGPGGAHIASREVHIYNVSVVPRTELHSSSQLGTVEVLDVSLPDNIRIEFTTRDFSSYGGGSATQTISKFYSLSSTQPAPFPTSEVGLVMVEDESSSSSSSTSSTSSL